LDLESAPVVMSWLRVMGINWMKQFLSAESVDRKLRTWRPLRLCR
jgi:hypothetical protein